MRKKIKKVIPGRYQDGLSQLRPNAGGIDIGASEVWTSELCRQAIFSTNNNDPRRRKACRYFSSL